MPTIDEYKPGASHFLMGNEAISRGALEAGVHFASAYPGTPSSEIIQRLSGAAKSLNLYAEWSTNEKVAAEGAAAAAFAGLRSLVAMKNAGLSVALDYLTHLAYTGLGDGEGAMVTAVCDDPDAHSSGDETDSRWLAKFACTPLVEPTTVQEAKDLVKWAFALSEEFKCNVMFRGYTRLCHASSTVEMGTLERIEKKAVSDNKCSVTPYLAKPNHAAVLEKLEQIRERFEASPFNVYQGPEELELLILCGGSGWLCAMEALEALDLTQKVGILRLGTLWPFPNRVVRERMETVKQVLVLEEVDPFIEMHLKELLADAHMEEKVVHGKGSKHIPAYGEIAPDRVIQALSGIFGLDYPGKGKDYQKAVSDASDELLVSRGLTWCAGCPHRASFWALGRAVKADGRNAYVTGDIGCYTLDVFPEGKGQMNLLHAMGSGCGLAAGFGQLGKFGYDQPVIAICGDSTFFHGTIPALVNAVYNRSNMIQIILDNSATAMTGFQAHPGTGFNAMGDPTTKVDVEALCRSIGCEVTVSDPFDIKGTVKAMRDLLHRDEGVRVLILRRACEIVRMKTEKNKLFNIAILEDKCKGEECGVCSSAFRCPALYQDSETGKTRLKEEMCSGCGVCTDICPFQAITREETAS
ncbi:MAG: 4Fe-4S binding protein [Deltaproteobacteria bacterium]|jgi:indolepyruvate ferredoxin oxidoreductase, alpha subunit|nr:4Fe-4S binding protein [Deltaproteobacteria bacterium]